MMWHIVCGGVFPSTSQGFNPTKRHTRKLVKFARAFFFPFFFGGGGFLLCLSATGGADWTIKQSAYAGGKEDRHMAPLCEQVEIAPKSDMPVKSSTFQVWMHSTCTAGGIDFNDSSSCFNPQHPRILDIGGGGFKEEPEMQMNPMNPVCGETQRDMLSTYLKTHL